MKKVRLLSALALIALFIGGGARVHAQEIYGTDFWFSFVDNLGVVGVSAGPASTYPFRLVIISVHNVKGTITTPNLLTASGAPWSQAFTVAANSQTTIVLPYAINGVNAFVDAENVVQGKAFHITTDSTATVYAVNDGTPGGGASTDGEVVLPTDMLGTNYVVNSRSSYWAANPTSFNVIATENGTNVTIKTLSYTGTQSDATYNITLNKGQTYQCGYYISDVAGNQPPYNVLTGSTVTASKPVAVISTTTCGGADDCGACDVMMNEQMPISFWGNKYILAQPIKRNTTTCGSNGSTSEADYVEIVGKVGQVITFTNWNGTFTKTITKIPGSSFNTYGYLWYDNPFNPSLTSSEFNGESNLVITSAQPFGVVQYQKGWQTDNYNPTDPEASVCYPESMWTNNYLAGTASLQGGASTQDIVIMINNVGTPAPISTMKIVNIASGASVPVGTTICPAGSNVPPGEGCWQAIKGPAGSNYMFYRALLPASGVPYSVSNTGGYNFGYYFTTRTAACSYIVQGGGGSEPPVSLPIELLSFEARSLAEKVSLTWITATEKNSESYIMERSADGYNFTSISNKIPAAGNSSVRLNYSFIDAYPLAGTNYYRLKETDIDGKITYSSVKEVTYRPDRVFMLQSIDPNPFLDHFTVTFNCGSSGLLKYSLVDVLGRKIQSGTINTLNGENKLSLEAEGLQKGYYMLNMEQEGADQAIQTRIVKD